MLARFFRHHSFSLKLQAIAHLQEDVIRGQTHMCEGLAAPCEELIQHEAQGVDHGALVVETLKQRLSWEPAYSHRTGVHLWTFRENRGDEKEKLHIKQTSNLRSAVILSLIHI